MNKKRLNVRRIHLGITPKADAKQKIEAALTDEIEMKRIRPQQQTACATRRTRFSAAATYESKYKPIQAKTQSRLKRGCVLLSAHNAAYAALLGAKTHMDG